MAFVGTSTISGWSPSLNGDFPGMAAFVTGINGGQVVDLIRCTPARVMATAPSAIVLYAGENDIAAGTTPAIAARQLAGLIHLLRRQHPGLRIYLLSVKPSPARWLGWPQMLALNLRIQRLAASQAESRYIDLSSAMLGRNGRPRPELFMADGVHLNRAGYRLWAQLVREAMLADRTAPLAR